MPFSFPASPAVNDQSTQNGRTYSWSGYAWEIVATPATLPASVITSGTLDAARLPLATTGAAGALIVGTGLGVSSGTVSVTYGTTSGTACQGNDSRLSDARTPTSHTHGNITNAGAIGSTANLPVITTTSGVLTTGTFGTSASSFCEGNDARLSDQRTPTDNTVSTAKIQNDAVTYAKIQNVSATDRLLGRSSAGAGDVEELDAATARTVLSVQPTASPAFTASGSASAVVATFLQSGLTTGNFNQVYIGRSAAGNDCGTLTFSSNATAANSTLGLGVFGASFALTLDGNNKATFAGQVLVTAGSVSACSVAPTGDPNTGLYFPAANVAAVVTDEVERVRVKATGSVRFVPLGADPASGNEAGDVYYNSSTNKLRVYNGTSWVDLH